MAQQPVANDESGQDEPKKKSKILPIIGIVVLALGAGAGGAWFFKSEPDKAAHAEQASDDEVVHQYDPAKPATFVELDPFTFNLMDQDQDRFAQIGIVLAVADPAIEDELTTVEPAVRNALLMLLTSKTSQQLLSVDGKLDLSDQIIDAANAILAGQPAPEIHVPTPATRKKIQLKMKKSPAQRGGEDDHRMARGEEKIDHEADDSHRSRRKSRRRGPKIPERVYAAHFSKFLIQ